MQTSPPKDKLDHVVALFNAGQFAAVADTARMLTKRYPKHSFAWKALGGALKKLGQAEAALLPLLRAAQIRPNDAECHKNLAITLRELNRLPEAEQSFRRACVLEPNSAPLLTSWGIVLADLGRLQEAEQCHQQALKIDPSCAEAYLNLGASHGTRGELNLALTHYQRAIELKPNLWSAWSSLLCTFNYMPRVDASIRTARTLAFGERLSAHTSALRYTQWTCDQNPTRLKIGLVSGDLHQHPVGYFLRDVIAQIDPKRLSLHVYSNSTRQDALTVELRSQCASWHETRHLDDGALARLIRDNGIHVLLDLSGHTEGNRLPMFANKPAPVAAAWLGYFATTGVNEIDYIMVDSVGVPEGCDDQFAERVWRLPETRLCFSTPRDAPPVATLPMLANGYLALGCYQSISKITDEVLALWASVLTEIPNARLRVQNHALSDTDTRQALSDRMQRGGIDIGRFELRAAADYRSYLESYANVDFVLDSFPFPGGTTTCDALWMGVPTLTLSGDTLLSRQGRSILTTAGLSDWVAQSPDEYLKKAVHFATNAADLAALRSGLRERVAQSALFDAKKFARRWEDALWGMWKAGPLSAERSRVKVGSENAAQSG